MGSIVKNSELIKYYANMPADLNKYEYTKVYNGIRKKCEACGKTIQAANKFYNNFGRLLPGDNVKNNDYLFYEYICNESNRKEMKVFSELEVNEAVDMIHRTGDYEEYNQKWHLLIAYYALLEFYNIEEKDGKTSHLNLNKEVSNWNPKGRKIQDPLLLLWMTEAAGGLTDNIKNFIDELSNRSCPHATKDDDKNLINMFIPTLWEEVARKIKEK